MSQLDLRDAGLAGVSSTGDTSSCFVLELKSMAEELPLSLVSCREERTGGRDWRERGGGTGSGLEVMSSRGLMAGGGGGTISVVLGKSLKVSGGK